MRRREGARDQRATPPAFALGHSRPKVGRKIEPPGLSVSRRRPGRGKVAQGPKGCQATVRAAPSPGWRSGSAHQDTADQCGHTEGAPSEHFDLLVL